MQTFTIAVIILSLGVLSCTPASASQNVVPHDLESLTEDMLQEISSRLPLVDHFNLGSASRYLQRVFVYDNAIVSTRLFQKFGVKDCLVAALNIEDAPPGSIVQVVLKLLRTTQFEGSHVQKALEQAYTVGHCDLVDVLSDHLQTPQFYGDNGSVTFDRASCGDVTQLASLPLADLLRMHALPRPKFLQVLAAKYRDSGYGSFFKDTAWYSQYYSNTVMSHALHLYEVLNGTVDFEPVPFGHIASTQPMSARARMTLENLNDSLLPRPDLPVGHFHILRHKISHLQSVLSPGTEMDFFYSSSLFFRYEFLLVACRTGRLDWVEFMVNHDAWNDVKMDVVDLGGIGLGWLSAQRVMRFDDVLALGDPIFSAFNLVFGHQMNRLPSSWSLWLCNQLLILLYPHSSPFFSGRKLVADYIWHHA